MGSGHAKDNNLANREQTIAITSAKSVLVTGGNSGIGYGAVKAFLESGKAYHVLLGSHFLGKAKIAMETLHERCPGSTNTVKAVHINLASDNPIKKGSKQVKTSPRQMDTLINNGANSGPDFLAADTVGKGVGGVTNTAGNAVGGLGNVLGDTLKGTTGTLGDATKGVGNVAKDTTGGVGDTARSATGAKQDAQNPLGLSE
ncbi:MAG: hypothetical protein ASARMPREDX12_005579 [Alectoria sarmentosa]|nr:MAG: hypothetical protein ASARMPREDX12_005579 [Alectoria sarmentosa]